MNVADQEVPDKAPAAAESSWLNNVNATKKVRCHWGRNRSASLEHTKDSVYRHVGSIARRAMGRSPVKCAEACWLSSRMARRKESSKEGVARQESCWRVRVQIILHCIGQGAKGTRQRSSHLHR